MSSRSGRSLCMARVLPGPAAAFTPARRRQRPDPAGREAGAARGLRGADLLAGVLRGLARVVGDALGVLAAALLRRLGRLRGDVLGDLLAALDGLLAGLGRLGLDLVGDRADLLVLDARGRDQHAGDEADRGGPDGEPERVLLGDPDRALGGVLDVAAARGRAGDGVLRAGHLRLEAVHLLVHRFLGSGLDVGLVRERVDGVAHALAGVLYLCADRARVFAHSTSSFTVSTVCSGTGGVAAWMRSRPLRPRNAATAT